LALYRITWLIRRQRLYAAFREHVLPTTLSKKRLNVHERQADLIVPVLDKEEFLSVAKALKCRISEKNKWITTNDPEAYQRLVVYAVVRATMRRNNASERLIRLVLSNDSYADVLYWSSCFLQAYERYKSFLPLRRLARAFKLVFNLSGTE